MTDSATDSTKPGWRSRWVESGRALVWRAVNLRAWRKSSLAMLGCVLAFVAAIIVFSNVPEHEVASGLAFGIPALLMAILFMRRLRYSYWTIAVVALALCLYALYFSYTTYGKRNFDGQAQLDYLLYFAKNLSIPPDEHCFICHHPPLYYAIAAGVHRFCKWSEVTNPDRAVQLISMVYSFALTIFSLQLMRRFTRKTWVITLLAALLMFWPYSILNSVRMHNDILLNTTCVGSLYYIVVWQQEGRLRSLILACVFAALAVLTKSSGYVMVGTILVITCYKLLLGRERLRFLIRTVPVLVVLMVTLSSHTLTRGEKPEVKMTLVQRLLGTANEIGARAFVGNEPFNYLYFDVRNFLEEPYILARRDGTGRQYFWNHLLKSSLFATHNHFPDAETSYTLNRRIAAVMNFLLLAILAFTASGVLRMKRDSLRRYLAPMVCVFGFLIAELIFRTLIPHSHHADFRFIHTILIPGCVACVMTLEGYRRRRSIMELVGWLLVVPFIVLSIIYYIPKLELSMKYIGPVVIEKNESELDKVIKEKTKWDEKSNTILGPDYILEIKLARSKTVAHIDTTLDHNDQYEITLHGREGDRKIVLGKSKKNLTGLARYEEVVDPPVKGVRKITLKPLSGDYMYSVGHFIVRSTATPEPATHEKAKKHDIGSPDEDEDDDRAAPHPGDPPLRGRP